MFNMFKMNANQTFGIKKYNLQSQGLAKFYLTENNTF